MAQIAIGWLRSANFLRCLPSYMSVRTLAWWLKYLFFKIDASEHKKTRPSHTFFFIHVFSMVGFRLPSPWLVSVYLLHGWFPVTFSMVGFQLSSSWLITEWFLYDWFLFTFFMVVFGYLHRGFEFRGILLLACLSIKAREPSLPCCFTHQ